LASFIRNGPQAQAGAGTGGTPQPGQGFARFHLQKLYGVVLLTETAQARLENGSTITAEDLAQIGESARQTLRNAPFHLPDEAGRPGT